MGTRAASGGDADLSLFEATCDSDEEAADAEWRFNATAKLNRLGRGR